jgi:hypothetical protein
MRQLQFDGLFIGGRGGKRAGGGDRDAQREDLQHVSLPSWFGFPGGGQGRVAASPIRDTENRDNFPENRRRLRARWIAPAPSGPGI